MMRALLLIFFALSLAGCDAAAAYREADTAKARTFKDGEARLLIDSTCAMGIGAWNRLTNPNEQVGAMLLCGGQTNQLLQMRAGSIELEPMGPLDQSQEAPGP